MSFSGILAQILEEEGFSTWQRRSEAMYVILSERRGPIPGVRGLTPRSGPDVRKGYLGEPGHPATNFYATSAGGDDLPENASFLDSVKIAGKLLPHDTERNFLTQIIRWHPVMRSYAGHQPGEVATRLVDRDIAISCQTGAKLKAVISQTDCQLSGLDRITLIDESSTDLTKFRVN